MKNTKKCLSLLVLLLSLSFLVSCNNQSFNYSIDDAKRIAVENAGTTIENTNFSSVEQQSKDGTIYYDVEFVKDGIKYEYDVTVDTGVILEVEVNDIPVQVDNVNLISLETTNIYISIDEAKNAALIHANLTIADVVFTETILDYEDGIVIYDVEFFTTNKEYDYDINAFTGAVVKVEVDNEQNHFPTESTTTASQDTYITVESAKEIALAHAKISNEEILFCNVIFDYDDRIATYEVEFVTTNYEYEYEILAIDGTILEVDKERN